MINPSLPEIIHQAAQDPDLSTLKTALDQYPEGITVKNEHGEQPLVTAAVAGHLEAVSLLLEYGADPTVQKGFALTCACYYGHVAVVQALLAGGADVIVREQSRWHGLHAACGWGQSSRPNAEIVRLLLAAGANPCRRFQGYTPLQYAQQANQAEIMAILEPLC